MASPEGGRQPIPIQAFRIQQDGIPTGFSDRRPPGAVSRFFEPVSLAPGGTLVSFANKERKVDRQNIFSIEWVDQAVKKERLKPIPRGETPWYHLPGTGFWVKEQIARLMRNGNLADVGEDTRAFEREYLKQMISLRWNLAIGKENGEKRIVCTDYDNATLESVTSKRERQGIVYDTLFGNKKRGIVGVEEQILNAPVGTMAIIVSPEGWSGMLDADGKSITYPEMQTYGILKVSDDTLQAYTFRTKANIVQNEALQRSLGLSTPKIVDQRERIKSVLSNVAIITPGDADWAELEGRRGVRGFEDLIDLIQESVGGREVAYEGKTFSDMHAYLRHPEKFDHRHPLTDKLIKRFEDYARWRFAQPGSYQDIETDLQIALAFNPTQLSKLYRDEENVTMVNDNMGLRGTLATQRLVRDIQRPGGMNYKRELQHLQELPGCAGGGTSGSVINMGNSRPAEAGGGSSSDYEFDHDGTCVVCNGGPKRLGPCNICISCDAELGGKGASMMAESTSKKEEIAAAEPDTKKELAFAAH